MGLASKIQAAGPRPAAGGAPQGQVAPPQQSAYGQQSSYGQPSGYGQAPSRPSQQGQPPYPVPQASGQSQYGAPAPQMSTKPAGYSANQPSSNPYAQGPPGQQQSQYGAPQSQSGYGQPQQQGYAGQPPQQRPPQGQGQYGQPAGQGQYGQPAGQGQYGQPTGQGQYGQQPGPPQYGAPQGQASPAQHSGSAIRDNLTRIVRENQLEVFYPFQKLQQVIQKVEAIDFKALSAQWDIPMEIATDLAALALYDVVLYCDDSGSMRAEERGERIDDLKLILSRVAEVATLFDEDGIQVRFMNSDTQGNGIRHAAAASQLVEQVRFSGITPLATQLDRKVIQPLVMQAIRSRALQKPVLVVVITDGEPVGEPRDLTRRTIAGSTQQAAQQGFPGALRFQFAQVGKDMKAQSFLSELDNDPQIGKVIDAISYFELEAMEMEKKGITLTPDLWLVKLCVGAIDASYDEQDE